jgi:hypothetical protein
MNLITFIHWNKFTCRISVPHGSGYEEICFLGYNAATSARSFSTACPQLKHMHTHAHTHTHTHNFSPILLGCLSATTLPLLPSPPPPSSSSFGYTILLSLTFASLTHLFLDQYKWLDLFFNPEDGGDMFLHNIG